MQVLFELARYHAPSTIFLDEIDALMTVRGSEGEHEASRRTKTEFLIQMDGLAQCNAQVFVLAATNLPWQLDLVRFCVYAYPFTDLHTCNTILNPMLLTLLERPEKCN